MQYETVRISNSVIWHLLQREKDRSNVATFLHSPKEMPKRLLIRDDAHLWNGNLFLIKNGGFFNA